MSGQIYDQIDEAVEKIRSGQVAQGLAILQMLMSEADGQPDFQLLLADVFYDLGHVDTALALLNEAEVYFDELTTDMQIEARTLKAEIMIDLGDLDEAMSELLICVDLEPDYTRASILLADIYLMQNLPEVACRHLENIVEVESDQDDVRYILSDLYIQMGEFEKAQDHLDQLRGTELEQQAKMNQARLWSQMGRFEEAYDLFLQCWREENGTEALFGLTVTALQLERIEEAVGYAKELLKIDSSHIGAYQVLAEAYHKTGQLTEAEQALHSALEHGDQDESILLKLVEVTYDKGELEEAKKYVEQLLNVNDENERALEWNKRLQGFIN
ncbi:tetratricopeptide repeat protein [Ammoniphilus sp. CFH 90114]|uniref:tetratricopeptide repeat protein n=1 Tax=Ammoniphilus sp. CFH 90114 TaxID=2493665 RepID=UPI00100E6A8F|nr:tetratricopeptide repeat protein [Ammoniphilus sp. CFH 90114]RXT13926.1 tetratricopeptide repeat protein [Ammoniphilus sp. CFH 90114]